MKQTSAAKNPDTASRFASMQPVHGSTRNATNLPSEDHRPESIQMQKLQSLANNYTPKEEGGLVGNSYEVIQRHQLQELADGHQRRRVFPVSSGQKTVQRMLNTNFAPITTQAALNAALALLNPPVRGMIPAQYQARGATLQMLDAAIAASNLNLYNGMSRGELLRELRPLIDHEVATTAATYTYDAHGDKHFPGGPPGSKFNAGKGVVNPQLVALITAQIARIRRDANGNNQSYYYTLPGIPACGGDDLTIQVDYSYAGDTVTYHGYPDDSVVAYSLSRVKSGAAIP
ncbi:MAG: hypothetical protein AAGA66_18325 [Bacteroidota bacterium]